MEFQTVSEANENDSDRGAGKPAGVMPIDYTEDVLTKRRRLQKQSHGGSFDGKLTGLAMVQNEPSFSSACAKGSSA